VVSIQNPANLMLCCRSTNTPRAAVRKSAAAAGFSFRLEERAEKRKEVCTIFHSGVLIIQILSTFRFSCTEGP
jgi:hypothetical protein